MFSAIYCLSFLLGSSIFANNLAGTNPQTFLENGESVNILTNLRHPYSPFNITATSTDFSVSLHWNLPLFSQENRFTVWYRRVGEKKWGTVRPVPHGNTKVRISSLDPGSLYEFVVLGVDNVDNGESVERIQVRTQGGIPPRFIHTSNSEIYAKIGKSIFLHCQAEGLPAPHITWYKDSEELEPSSRITIIMNSRLHISSSRKEDEGNYRCKATNDEGSIEHNSKVLIGKVGILTVSPQNLTVVEREEIELACKWQVIQPDTSTTVQWLKDGIPVKSSTHVKQLDNGSLIINPVQSNDSGFYTCVLSDEIDHVHSEPAYLNVEFPARLSNYAQKTTDLYLALWSSTLIPCDIQSNPAIHFVTWTQNNQLLEFDKDYLAPGGFSVLSNGSLFVDRVTDSHKGIYRCTPYNIHGTNGASPKFYVHTTEPINFEQIPYPDYHRKLGSNLTIPCAAYILNKTTATIMPITSLTWEKGGHVISIESTSRVRVHNGALQIDNLQQEDHGEYWCNVATKFLRDSVHTKIFVEGTRPHPPYNITVVSSAFSSVTISWSPGYSGGLYLPQTFILSYRILRGNEWTRIQVPESMTKMKVPHLKPQTTYEFKVSGTNDLGEGVASDTVHIVSRPLDGDKASRGEHLAECFYRSTATKNGATFSKYLYHISLNALLFFTGTIITAALQPRTFFKFSTID